MADSLAGIALAAGEGRRLRPLTTLRPKPLCPVGNRPLLDWALDALRPAVDRVAVNVHHGRGAMLDHLRAHDPDVHVSVEEAEALGTAGGVAQLADWLDGGAALVVNADTWHRVDLAEFAAGWDGERVRICTPTPGPFGPRSAVVASILPPWAVARCAPEPSGLWEVLWSAEVDAGRIDTSHTTATVIDCGTPSDYLRANLTASGGTSVIGEGALVLGTVDRCVVWPGEVVAAGEHLVESIRAGGLTVDAS